MMLAGFDCTYTYLKCPKARLTSLTTAPHGQSPVAQERLDREARERASIPAPPAIPPIDPEKVRMNKERLEEEERKERDERAKYARLEAASKEIKEQLWQSIKWHHPRKATCLDP